MVDQKETMALKMVAWMVVDVVVVRVVGMVDQMVLSVLNLVVVMVVLMVDWMVVTKEFLWVDG